MDFEISKIQKNKNKYLEHLLKTEPNSNFAKNIQSKIDELDNKIKKLTDKRQVYKAQFNLASDEKADTEQILKNLANFKKSYHSLDF